MVATSCAPICFMTIWDEESWKLRQGMMAQRDPHNRTGWRHSRPGRITRWAGVMVELFGLRWKEFLLAEPSDEFVCVEKALAKVGRSYAGLRHADPEEDPEAGEQVAKHDHKRPRQQEVITMLPMTDVVFARLTEEVTMRFTLITDSSKIYRMDQWHLEIVQPQVQGTTTTSTERCGRSARTWGATPYRCSRLGRLRALGERGRGPAVPHAQGCV